MKELGLVTLLAALAFVPAAASPLRGLVWMSAFFVLLLAAFVFFWYGFACGKETFISRGGPTQEQDA